MRITVRQSYGRKTVEIVGFRLLVDDPDNYKTIERPKGDELTKLYILETSPEVEIPLLAFFKRIFKWLMT